MVFGSDFRWIPIIGPLDLAALGAAVLHDAFWQPPQPPFPHPMPPVIHQVNDGLIMVNHSGGNY